MANAEIRKHLRAASPACASQIAYRIDSSFNFVLNPFSMLFGV